MWVARLMGRYGGTSRIMAWVKCRIRIRTKLWCGSELACFYRLRVRVRFSLRVVVTCE